MMSSHLKRNVSYKANALEPPSYEKNKNMMENSSVEIICLEGIAFGGFFLYH